MTEVRYASGAATKAQFVLSELGGAGKVVPLASAPAGVDIVLVLGSDYNGLSRPAPKATTGATANTTPPTSGSSGSGSPSLTSLPVAGC